MQPVIDFIHRLTFDDLPDDVITQAQHCLLDLAGVAVAGHATRLSQILENFVCSQYPGDVPLLFSNRSASACGATLFGAMLIDSLDAHDGQVLTKGHVGVAILPALLAAAHEREQQGQAIDGREFIASLVLGYEIATRAGIALHRTACDYHTSGAWNGIGVAAVVARLRGLDASQTQEALGTAEFYGPRSQMMRCIDHPTMLKDGSGWGAMGGMSAALLAEAGFTGSPALTLSDAAVADIWEDLGQRWYILEQYFKAYPVCRWAQPAVEAVRELRRYPGFDVQRIREIHIHSFHEATRLHKVHPETTEHAQYSLPFSVASALLDDTISAQAIAETDAGLFHPRRRALAGMIRMHENADYNALFPAERWAHARLVMDDGSILESKPAIARGNPENPLTLDELIDKFHSLSAPQLPAGLRTQIQQQSLSLQTLDRAALNGFIKLLSSPLLPSTGSPR
ncbi:2-methylcitrate dehydratase [Marinobacterium aestuarii]|uniref:2-methylcitrate dehydratase n=1 Tax=Marinobacterium aestuarii TaxID=1821621 RepID=A0A1A9F5F5_9GAMM|nr:MmgE/PrpD family protein [Marinobacterium aestuarii]ANG65312.1 2-methylcitrate dehydratase [Marinobacterium aestuarii]